MTMQNEMPLNTSFLSLLFP